MDFSKTFAPVASPSTRRVFFSVVAEEDWESHLLDVRTTFMTGKLIEDVYIMQSPGI